MPAEAAAGPRVEAGQLVETAAERDALTGLRGAIGASDGAMERHGLRCFFICERLAGRHGLEVDRELLLVAGLVHDIGLYEEVSDGGVYVAEGRRFADGLLAGREGWDAERIERCGLASSAITSCDRSGRPAPRSSCCAAPT